MDDLISRKALIAEYDRVHIGEPGKARKLMEDAPAVQKWIPVTERLPEIGDTYLVVVKYKYDYEKEYTIDTDVAMFRFDGGYIDDCWDTYFDWDEGQQYINVTHWMPLPEPPKGE